MYIIVTFFTLLVLGQLQSTAALPTGFFREQVWGAGNSQPMNIEFLPGGRRALILDRRGKVLLLNFQAAPPTTKTVLSISSNVNSGDERGCLDIVLDPNFSANSFFYIYYSPAMPEQVSARQRTLFQIMISFSSSTYKAHPHPTPPHHYSPPMASFASPASRITSTQRP